MSTDETLPTTGRIVTRRKALGALGAFGALGALALAGCGGADDAASPRRSSSGRSTSTTSGGTATTSGSGAADTSTTSCTLVPQETAGPYPLDLSKNQQFFRQDITEGKSGVPFTLALTMLNVNKGCAPITNARVDVWHCDKDGVYSGYSQPGANTVGQTFCRGIQLTDSAGKVTFKTVYPGWYAGRITHVHFQVYLNSGLVATSQLAFPNEATTAVYGSALYRARGQNNSVTSFAQDNVFSDGTAGEMLSLSGDPSTGYTGTLAIGLAA
jgi:protocatechuate 3,4-dioxygenase beta subunit